jgi:hypothetical protein
MSINYTALAAGALSVTVALGWTNAIDKGVSSIFPRSSAFGTALVNAVAVTTIVVIFVAIFNYFDGGLKIHRDAGDEADGDDTDVAVTDGFGRVSSNGGCCSGMGHCSGRGQSSSRGREPHPRFGKAGPVVHLRRQQLCGK